MCLSVAAARADVTILSPTNGAVFPAYATVTIEVEPDFKDGDNAVLYGIVGNEYYPENIIAVRGTTPYSLTVSNLPAGTHRYEAWTGDHSTRDYVEIVVTNPPVHMGPYAVVDLDISPTGINNHGVVVGNSHDRAFTWDRGIIRWVPMPNSNRGAALAINDAGQITGLLYTTNNEGRVTTTAFLHSEGVTRRIEIPGADSSIGQSLSPRGDVVGTFLGEGGFPRGSFVYTAEGELRTNEMVFGDMNSWGLFAGTLDSGQHAVLWPPDEEMYVKPQLAPLLGRSGAEDINDAGQVAAWGRPIMDGRHNYHDAFLFSNYKLIKLTSGFYHEAYARALNRWGQVLVEVTETLHGPRDTFIGYGSRRNYVVGEDGGGTDLTAAVEAESLYALKSVVDINDHGQIVGTASNASGGLLLNPKPKVLETKIDGAALKMRVHERPGTTLKVQSSADFKSWSMVLTNEGGGAIHEVSIPMQEGVGRFFRVINDEEYGNQVVGN